MSRAKAMTTQASASKAVITVRVAHIFLGVPAHSPGKSCILAGVKIGWDYWGGSWVLAGIGREGRICRVRVAGFGEGPEITT